MDGLLLIDKPKGWTSHDVVAKVRSLIRQGKLSELKKLGISHFDAVQGGQEEGAKRTQGTLSERQTPADEVMRQEPARMSGFAGQQGKAPGKIRVGHAGTLDPLATGLLIVLVGKATKRQAEYMKLDKTYEVTLRLGETSATADAEGEKTVISDKKPTQKEVVTALQSFIGTIQQTPPAFSAIKVDGKRAYKLARAGKEVNIEPRTVTVHSIEKVVYNYPFAYFTATVSSGTYIRSLAMDIGEKLGTGAYMSDLRRTAIGQFNITEAQKMDELDLSKRVSVGW